MESPENRIIHIGENILFIPDEEEIRVHGKKAHIECGWAETEYPSWVRPYLINLGDLEKVPEFKLKTAIINQIFGGYTELNDYTKARRTIGGGLEISHRNPYKEIISTAEVSKEEYHRIKQYF